jgi:hypothetical protein
MARPILLTFFFGMLLVGVTRANEVYPSWYPKISCEKKWANLPNKGQYSYEQDAYITEKGNVGYQDYNDRVERESCLKEWTVLVYMAADNDLSPYALWDLHEMESRLANELNLGSSTATTDVIVELDTYYDTGVRRLHIFQSEEKYRDDLGLSDYERMDERFIRSPIIKSFPEIGEGRVQSAEARFKNFLSWGVQNYPAKNYMIVVWGHGEGFLGQFHEESFKRTELMNTIPLRKSDEKQLESQFFQAEDFILDSFVGLPQVQPFSLVKQFGGIAFDYSDQSFIDITSMGEILANWRDKLLEGKNFDFLAFDACLMQSMEVIAEVARSADFIAGSNQVQNYLGLPYRKLLDQINNGATPFELARTLPILTKESWGDQGYQGSVDPKGLRTFTMSTLAGAQIESNLFIHFHKVATQLLSYIKEEPRRKNELLFMLEKAPRFQGDMMDLGLFYGLIEKLLWEEALIDGETAKSTMLRQTVGEAHFRLKEVFIESQFGSLYYEGRDSERAGYLLGYFTGMSLWLPANDQLYNMRKFEMAKSSLFKIVTSWNSFLEELYKLPVIDLGPL